MLRTYQFQHGINKGKQGKIRSVIKAYRLTAQSIACRQWRLFFENKSGFDKDLDIKYILSSLSGRYKQTCQYQVIGILNSFISNRQNDFVQTVYRSNLNDIIRQKLFYINYHGFWYSNTASVIKTRLEIDVETLKLARRIFNHILKRHRRPSMKHINMALDNKVAVISEARPDGARSFDYWVRLSTLEKGYPVMLSVLGNPYYENIKGTRKRFCQINLTEDDEITVSFIKDVPRLEYIPITPKFALDLGLVYLFASDKGDLFGRQFYEVLQRYDALISKLTSNRQRQGFPIRNKRYRKLIHNLRQYMKNEINRVLNRTIELYKPAEIVVERLNFQNANLSRRMNRLLSWFGKSCVTQKLQSIQEEYGIIVTYTNPAYSSQECSSCSYVDKDNRKTQAEFQCKICNTSIHADVNGARNHLVRSSDKVIDIYKSKGTVLRVLTERFLLVAERIPRLYSKAKDLLPGNPYFRDTLAQSKGFL